MSLTGYGGDGGDRQRCFVNFNQDFTSLSVGTENGYRLYALNSIDSLDQVFEMDCGEVYYVERLFSSSLVAIVMSASPCTLRICHFKKGNEICTYNYSSRILSVHLNRLRLVVCLETSLFIHNIHDMKVLHRICDTPSNPHGLCALSASPSGTDGYLAYPGSCETGEVQIFDAIALRAVATVNAHNSPLAAVTFNCQATCLATASEKGTVIRVFSVPEGQKLFDFRRGVKRCAVIHSLSFSIDSLYLACTSNTETVHIFHLETSAERPSTDTGSQGWIDYFGQALRTSVNYLPSQVSEVLTQSRDYAVAKLPVFGGRSVCAISVIQKMPQLLVASEAGWLYVFSIEPISSGSECTLIRKHRIDGRCVRSPTTPDAPVEIAAVEQPTANKLEVIGCMTSPPRVGSQTRLTYANVVSPRPETTVPDCHGTDGNVSCLDDTGYCTPAEEVQIDWSGEAGTLRLDDDQEFPAVTRVFT